MTKLKIKYVYLIRFQSYDFTSSAASTFYEQIGIKNLGEMCCETFMSFSCSAAGFEESHSVTICSRV
jgi:hypothetical protein